MGCLEKWILAICLIFYAQHTQLFADQKDSFFLQSIDFESSNIQHVSSDDYTALSDLHASRGEDYLILGDDQKALEDFMLSYGYALKCKERKNHFIFRPLFGAFLVYIRLENIEAAQEMYVYLDWILKNACSEAKDPYLLDKIPMSTHFNYVMQIIQF